MPAQPPKRKKTDRVIDACMERLDVALNSIHSQVESSKAPSADSRPPTPVTTGFTPARFKKTKQQLMALTEEEELFDSDDEQFVKEHDSQIKLRRSSRVNGQAG